MLLLYYFQGILISGRWHNIDIYSTILHLMLVKDGTPTLGKMAQYLDIKFHRL